MSDIERENPENEPPRSSDSPSDEADGIGTSERQASFVQRLQRHFGDNVDPAINLQGDPEDSDSETSAPEPRVDDEPSGDSSTSLGLVKKLTEQVNLGSRYRIMREIARGGMGTVLRVWDDDLRRNLAMKVLHSKQRFDEESGGSNFDQEKLVRFLEEAQITGQLDHPGIVPVHDLGIDDRGRCYFTMRLVRGRELKEVFDLSRAGKERWTRTKVLTLILKVCEAMAFAHSKGVVHRDLKPSNIMVGRFGEVYVMDWGLARVLGRSDSRDPERERKQRESSSLSLVRTVRRDESEANPDSPLITMDGDVVGTPSFMAVEQARGRLDEIGPRSDVYSLGAVLYYMLTGRSPYVTSGERVSPHTVLNRVLQGPPESVAALAPNEPPELVAICEKAMSRNADDRYQTMLDVAEDVTAYIENRVVSAYEGGSWSEFRKWVTRNRGMAAAVAAMITLAIASALGLALQKQKRVTELGQKALLIQAETERAQRAAERAEGALALATQREAESEVHAGLARENLRKAEKSGYMANILAADFSLRLNDVKEARTRLTASETTLREWEWSHLFLRSHPALDTFGRNYTRPIDRLGWSSDAETLYVLSRDGRMRFLSSRNGETLDREAIKLAIVTATTFGALPPLSMSVSPGAQRIAIVGNDASVRVFDGETGLSLFKLPSATVVGHEARVGAIAYSRDGRHLVSGADNGSLIVWTANGGITHRLPPHSGAIAALAWSPDSKLFASASLDGTVSIWDADSGQRLSQLLGHVGAVRAVAWDDAGERVFTGGEDGLVNQWSSDRGRLISSFSGHTDSVRSIDYDPVASRILTSSFDKTVRVWDIATGEATVLRGHEANVLDARFSPDGRLVASGSERGILKLWDARGDLSTTDLVFHNWSVAATAFSPDGALVVSGDERGELVVWDSDTGESLVRIRAHTGSVEVVAFSPDGRYVFSASIDKSVRRWDVETGAEISAYVHDDSVVGLLVLPGGDRIVTTCADKFVRVFGVDSQLELTRFAGYRGTLRHLSLHADGVQFAATTGNYVVIRDLKGNEYEHRLNRKSFFHDCVFSPDGKHVVAATLRGEVCVWDVKTNKVVHDSDHRRSARAVAFHPYGKRFASGGTDGTVRVRDAETAKTILVLLWPGEQVRSLAFSPDGTRLLASADSGAIRIWETPPVTGRRRLWLENEELRERAAPIVERLFDEHFFANEVKRELQTDRSLDADVRQKAILLANLRGEDPGLLYPRSLEEAMVPGNDSSVYALALRRAEAAYAMDDGRDLPGVLLALGVARYRGGQHEGAVAMLERAEDLSIELSDGREGRIAPLTAYQDAVRLVFLSMARIATGRPALAADALDEATDTIENHPDLAYYRGMLSDVLREAESMVGTN